MSKKTTMVLVVSSNIIGNALKLQKIEKLHWQIGNEVINDNQKKNKLYYRIELFNNYHQLRRIKRMWSPVINALSM